MKINWLFLGVLDDKNNAQIGKSTRIRGILKIYSVKVGVEL